MHNFIEDISLSSVWKNLAPQKVEIFVWMALQECLVTREILAGKGIIPLEQDVCPLCGVHE